MKWVWSLCGGMGLSACLVGACGMMSSSLQSSRQTLKYLLNTCWPARSGDADESTLALISLEEIRIGWFRLSGVGAMELDHLPSIL